MIEKLHEVITENTKRIPLWVIGVVVIVIALLAFLLLFRSRPPESETVTTTPSVIFASPTAFSVSTVVVPTPTPVSVLTEKPSIKEVMFPITLPALFFKYSSGYFASDSKQGGTYDGVVASDVNGNWYIVRINPSVQWCEEVVISAPDATRQTLQVHPDIPVAIRRIHIVNGEDIMWGCLTKHGNTVWSSVRGEWGERCACTSEACIVNIYTSPTGEMYLLHSSSLSCVMVQNAKIIRLSEEEKKEKEVDVTLYGNWIVFGDFICSGGEHPMWKVCVGWDGNPVVPQFSESLIIRVEEK